MSGNTFFFAGGGTGGHIYPGLAVAEQIIKIQPGAKIHFFCSQRQIDARILAPTRFPYSILPARAFSARPDRVTGFCIVFFKSFHIAKKIMAESENPIVVGIGGFVAAPVCLAGYRLKAPVKLINVDIVPGKANRAAAFFADEVFVQFEQSARYFAKKKVSVVGCPLRAGFANPEPQKAIAQLGLDAKKNILLVTGASSGAERINQTVCSLLDKLDDFAESWQIVHLTGHGDFENVRTKYANARITHRVLSYCDNMADLLGAADLVIGRSGAVSVAEYAAAGSPSICMPYPHHRDMHQYLNAGWLVDAGAAVIVDDVPDTKDRAEWLWEELAELMTDDNKRNEMRQACMAIANRDAACRIAEKLIEYRAASGNLA
ncbi:MAG TPA: UDP-N-acetylglucosamine--N-acetylmuramyl-(pentapeptide) pyrophosphoryl-undecaprenol N-acetylglucosamine transferase [Sedimentisphaerales bacterium]|nr:UDP-N-acetylglucosamine--N-acetylmuramyl-(pentapeptide) pyrophosphoryl-undecaprenol N-acetylglucosamine transferase [Sedimentisphaerales bacterium]